MYGNGSRVERERDVFVDLFLPNGDELLMGVLLSISTVTRACLSSYTLVMARIQRFFILTGVHGLCCG